MVAAVAGILTFTCFQVRNDETILCSQKKRCIDTSKKE
jgi:hypothetical protein